MSSIVAVMVAALLAYIYTKNIEAKKAKIHVLEEFSRDLAKIAYLSEIYWLGDHSDQSKRHELLAAGYKLRSALMATAEYRGLMKSILKEDFIDFDSLDVKLFIACTGGKFQTSAMEASPETFQEISSLITKTEQIYRSRKSKL